MENVLLEIYPGPNPVGPCSEKGLCRGDYVNSHEEGSFLDYPGRP